MKTGKLILSSIAASLILASTAVAQGIPAATKDTVSNGLKDFANVLLFAVPEAATQQNVWADAYIGNLYPSIFPHFGVGASIGGTYIDTTGLKSAVEALTGEQNLLKGVLGTTNPKIAEIADKLKIGQMPDKFVLPTATVDVRLGGLFLPFDIGICAMMTNPSLFDVNFNDPSSISNMSQALNFKNLAGFDGFIDYLTIGADLRYRFFEGSTFIPVISLGGGYYFTKGNFKIGSSVSEKVDISGKTGTQKTDVDMGIGFQTQVIYAQLQISKEFKIATLFLGGRGVLSNTTTTWAWNYKTTNDNSEIAAQATESDSANGTWTAENASDSYKDGIWDMTKIQPQVYAGASLNLWKLGLTFGACADMRSFFDKVNYSDIIWSGFFSAHVKI